MVNVGDNSVMTSLTHQIRTAIDASELSRFAICQLAKIDQSAMSRFMSDGSGLSLASLDRLADVLALTVIPGTPPTKRKTKMSTEAGYMNQQGGRVVRRIGRSPSHPNQYTYEIECTHCGFHYGAKGCDIVGANAGTGRRCPNCQGGTEGDPLL